MSLFSKVPVPRVKHSTFEMKPEVKMGFDFGGLYPILTEQVLPGDRWSLSIENFIRTMPMLSPIMHRCDLKLDAFFVPNRIIWDDFEDFITKGPTGENTSVIPFMRLDSTIDYNEFNSLFASGSLTDYLGYNVDVPKTSGTVAIHRRLNNLLPFRAYQFIWSEYFRNQQLESEVEFTKTGGSQVYTSEFRDKLGVLRYRNYRRDYFTSCLPTPQKGPAVKMPGQVTVDGTYPGQVISPASNVQAYASSATDPGDLLINGQPATLVGQLQTTIEDLRNASTLQEFFEANARGGSRYVEHLLNIWNQHSSDARLQRPEYLGGYRGPIQISEVPQTSSSTESSVQGNLAGKGVSVGGQQLFKGKRFEEYGILMVLMSVVPKSSYQQGDRRFYLYEDSYDFPNPYFANLGEQAVYGAEIYASPLNSSTIDRSTWGYLPRYSEVKYIPDQVHGALRDSLDFWHLGRKFTSKPLLNQTFIKVSPTDASRVFPNVIASQKLIGEFMFNIRKSSSLPYYGVPRLNHV